ncbi:unnamed protein product [Onchocerca flexuosa]|uniref:Uncharacterized protein n=1 Tax=Onchocerca flexuosa TaxID=387005 RepID=A0A183HA76_9BILA|nr:unnamed protein product [Onchocerca flexuosa]
MFEEDEDEERRKHEDTKGTSRKRGYQIDVLLLPKKTSGYHLMMGMNGAFILSQLWLVIAVRSTDDYDEKGLAITTEVDFPAVNQETSSTSFPLNNLTQRPHQQHDENHSLEERNHRFQAHQERKGLLYFNGCF